MKLNLAGLEHLIGAGPFRAATDVPSFAGISGGRTSAMMAALLDPKVQLCFQNTGREDNRTLDFLERLEDGLQRPITWLEWRPPPKMGDPPRLFSFEVVTPATATRRSNRLLAELFRYLNGYRDRLRVEGRELIAQGLTIKEAGKRLGYTRLESLLAHETILVPSKPLRLCTAYLKHRTMEKWIKSLGVVDERGHLAPLEWFVGLRFDEPDRIARLMDQQTASRSYRTPLGEAGVEKPTVNTFWGRQPFDLELPDDSYGNCDGCFLKNEADIARALGRDIEVGDDWVDLEIEFPGFGRPRKAPSYAQLRYEYPTRLRIEETLRHGFVPEDDGRLEPKRFRLVVKQEEKRLRGESESFSCACEQTIALADSEDGDEEEAA